MRWLDIVRGAISGGVMYVQTEGIHWAWATAWVYPWVSEQTPIPIPAAGMHPWEWVQVWGMGLPAGAALDMTTMKMMTATA